MSKVILSISCKKLVSESGLFKVDLLGGAAALLNNEFEISSNGNVFLSFIINSVESHLFLASGLSNRSFRADKLEIKI